MLRMQLQGTATTTANQGQIILQAAPTFQQATTSVMTSGQNGTQIIHS